MAPENCGKKNHSYKYSKRVGDKNRSSQQSGAIPNLPPTTQTSVKFRDFSVGAIYQPSNMATLLKDFFQLC